MTGAAALLLQKFGALTPTQVGDYLRSHARGDGFTGTLPSNDWGHGKLGLGDLIDPAVSVVSPNGGEQPHMGDMMNLLWSASDSLGSVSGVDLLLSRTGPGGPFETLALAVPNTGSFSWTVNGPATAPGAAWLRVVAHDTNSNIGSDLSDGGFWIRGVAGVDDLASGRFALASVGPNPALHGVRVEFLVGRETPIELTVRDVQGRTVAVLANGVHRAGRHVAVWDGMERGGRAAPGLRFVCYRTIEGQSVRRVAIVR